MADKQQADNLKKDVRARKKGGLNPTTQSLIGVFVFALGFAAVIAVAYLGYVKYFYQEPSVTKQRGTLSDPSFHSSDDEIKNRKLEKSNLSDMRGQWGAKYNNRRAYLDIDNKDNFKLSVWMDEDGYDQSVSFGSAYYDEEAGFVRLVPSDVPISDMQYEGELSILTRRDYQIAGFKDKNDGGLYWFVPIANQQKLKMHPLFVFLGRKESGFLKWQKVNSMGSP